MDVIRFPNRPPGERDVLIDYTPQPKQRQLSECPANEILYGGSAGPGKSHAIRHEALAWCTKIPKLHVYLFRRTYPELEKNHIIPIQSDWGNRYGFYNDGKKLYKLPNGSIIHMCHAQHEKSVMLYHGAEIHILVIDELSTFTEWQYVYLRNRVRCTLDIPAEYKGKVPGVICGSNPGGPGHEFCKRMFVDFCSIEADEAAARKVDPIANGPVYEHPHRRLGKIIYYGLRRAKRNDGGMLRAYIPGLLEDNQILMQKDPGYIYRVEAMPEPFRSAYLDGDWDIFIGQMFNFNKAEHVIPPHPIPKHAPIYMTFDWGFGAPFSVGYCYADADNRLFRFGEIYGWTKAPNQGIRKTDSEIAEMILDYEKEIGLRTKEGGHIVKRGGKEGSGYDCGRARREIQYILSPDCFSKKPDYKGGGQGPSTSEVFTEYGIISMPGDATRDQKVKQFHERLRVPADGVTAPMFQVFDTCKQFIRTIPLLQQDENNPEDVDTDNEDHCYDEQALLFMARPLSLIEPLRGKSSYDRRLDELERGDTDSYDHIATMQAESEMQWFEDSKWDHLPREEYDDGDYHANDHDLIDTVD